MGKRCLLRKEVKTIQKSIDKKIEKIDTSNNNLEIK